MMSPKLTPFRVHFDAVAGIVPEPVSFTAATPKAAETEALRRHPGRCVRKVKVEKSGGQP
ncbi:MAG: hypothetical protein V7704_20775 [Aurantimonas endophytica]|uniref:hypothetical protein n=1 Tax=Aurantimonas endophytica TaxID=1522175 RepID=UPI0030015CDF